MTGNVAAPAPQLQGYSRESAIAEKFQARVYLGEINSRMKDFFDIWTLASSTTFDGLALAEGRFRPHSRDATRRCLAPP